MQEHAYQADVLSDPQQKYWIEALPEPFAIQFKTEEETAIAHATETLWEICVTFLDWFFTEETEGAGTSYHRGLSPCWSCGWPMR